MSPYRLLLIVLCLLLTLPAHAAPDSLTRFTSTWKGDLPELLKNKHPIRVLVSYNRTNYFLVNGAMRGLEYDLMTAFGKHLEKTHKKNHVRMVFVTVPFEDLIPALLEGRGDIAAAGLTVTAGRKAKITFSAPYRTGINEIVVGSRRAAPIRKIEDLAGKTVHVLAGSSYATHLAATSETLKRRGMKPIRIMKMSAHLVTEDLLEMAERGMINYTMADSHLGEIWQSALPGIQLFTDVPIHSGGDMAWAVRPGSKHLLESLNTFASTVRTGTLMGNMVFKRYFVNPQWVKDPDAHQEPKKLQELKDVFQKYGREYDFDWLKLAALAFQESRLNMKTKSNKGAVGIMQIKPSTAADSNVGIDDITTLDGNVHAGTKYLRYLRDNFFTDAPKEAQVDFALAAYNAGPFRIKKLRKTAEAMGLDPNIWFGNVEWAAYRDIGPETPTYVANVQMYYAAYKSIWEELQNRERVK